MLPTHVQMSSKTVKNTTLLRLFTRQNQLIYYTIIGIVILNVVPSPGVDSKTIIFPLW
ncbi:hypothetical protein HNR74_001099 [Flammeovirga kamogawensis]|nr:hypothetical protein [Flammeovirga kamogawensis]